MFAGPCAPGAPWGCEGQGKAEPSVAAILMSNEITMNKLLFKARAIQQVIRSRKCRCLSQTSDTLAVTGKSGRPLKGWQYGIEESSEIMIQQSLRHASLRKCFPRQINDATKL